MINGVSPYDFGNIFLVVGITVIISIGVAIAIIIWLLKRRK